MKRHFRVVRLHSSKESPGMRGWQVIDTETGRDVAYFQYRHEARFYARAHHEGRERAIRAQAEYKSREAQ